MIEREINKSLEDFRKDWNWGYGEMAFKLDENMTGEQYKRYILEDRLTGDMVARGCKLMNKPYAPLQDVLSGQMGPKLKEMLFDAGLTARLAILRVFPNLKKGHPTRRKVNGLYQAFADNSRDPFWISVVYQACRKPCVGYDYLLNKDELKELAKDMDKDDSQMELIK